MITFASGGESVEVRNPSLGDTRNYTFSDSLVTNRYGESVQIPTSRTLADTYSWTLTTLCDSQRVELIDFLKPLVGKIIQITDYDGVTHDAIITTNPLNPITINIDNNQLELSFQVV